ncbi:hypothetical protein F4680DRAFT_448112 [Xylaria scruposa]|nr:hypothetical protein F4680DRAFT_448112 [Xylaria scruposa]
MQLNCIIDRPSEWPHLVQATRWAIRPLSGFLRVTVVAVVLTSDEDEDDDIGDGNFSTLQFGFEMRNLPVACSLAQRDGLGSTVGDGTSTRESGMEGDDRERTTNSDQRRRHRESLAAEASQGSEAVFDEKSLE